MLDSLAISLKGETFETIQDQKVETFTFCQKMVSSRSPVYLASSQNNKKVAVKIYENHQYTPSVSFLNESRFSNLSHETIIKFFPPVQNFQIQGSANNKKNYGLIVMELARCNLEEFISSVQINEKIARSFFHQIVDGVEFLHSKNISHMDLKLSNILVGSDFNLKIADFDFAYKKGDLILQGLGSENFRAPEVLSNGCRIPEKADIYSLGIILFCLVFGHFPYAEDKEVHGFDLYDLLLNQKSRYWEVIEQIRQHISIDSEIKELIGQMVCKEPNERCSIEEIKKNKWYNKEIYSKKDLKLLMKSSLFENFNEI